MYTTSDLDTIQARILSIQAAHNATRLSPECYKGIGVDAEAPVSGIDYLSESELAEYLKQGFLAYYTPPVPKVATPSQGYLPPPESA